MKYEKPSAEILDLVALERVAYLDDGEGLARAGGSTELGPSAVGGSSNSRD